MTTARQLLTNSFIEIGAHSELQPADESLYERGLSVVISKLSEFKDRDIIIEDDNTTIVIPTTLDSELSEPPASTYELELYFAARMFKPARTASDDAVVARSMRAYDTMYKMYKVHTIPKKRESTSLSWANKSYRR